MSKAADEHTPLQSELPHPSGPPNEQSRGIQKGCLLQFLTIFSSLIIVCAVGISFLQVLGVYYLVSEMTFVRAAIRIYVVLFSFIVILNELEWSALVRNSIISYSWIARGMFYSFIGFIVLDQHVGHQLESQIFRLCFSVCGDTLVVSGAVYILMGLLCLKRARDER